MKRIIVCLALLSLCGCRLLTGGVLGYVYGGLFPNGGSAIGLPDVNVAVVVPPHDHVIRCEQLKGHKPHPEHPEHPDKPGKPGDAVDVEVTFDLVCH